MKFLNPSESRYIGYLERDWAYYGYHNPQGLTPSQKTTIETEFIFIPYWIRDAMVRFGLTDRDLYNYNKIRECFAPIDIARFLATQKIKIPHLVNYIGNGISDTEGAYPVTENAFYTLLWSMWDEMSKNPKAYTEFNEIILPLVDSEQIKLEVVDMLSFDPSYDGATLATNSLDELPEYYSTSLIDNNFFLIDLKKGFLSATEARDYCLRFVSDYLKAQHCLSTIKTVVTGNMFTQYLKLL